MNSESRAERFKGVMTALVTPFKNENVDYEALASLAEWQIQSGIDALVPCGTTGEAPTLTWEERLKIIKTCVRISNGRVPVIAGTGTNCTRSTIAQTISAQACGAEAVLIVTPYYNKPNQEGIAKHFEAIANNTDIPIIAYNVPSRTGVDIAVSTLDRMAQLPSIIGIKDATGDARRSEGIRTIFGARFNLLSGHDETAAGFMLSGGDGVISVASNVLPHVLAAMYRACKNGRWSTVRYIQDRIAPVLKAFSLETNPCPVKYGLRHRLGLSDEVRLPLVPVTSETAYQIRTALNHLGGQIEKDGSEAIEDWTRTPQLSASTPLAWRL
ncbi:4-hydroxy-tetrahydrodipicolinate synthase [Phyllobacterium sp. 0TCS1.6C]|uniref:4-hydroxy-tetrahydrodipicolinate synthase n=1 Tax=unclassified Phyllobacterium TaxID=2638441 RepID=UPI002263DA0C|nr:MULTISPECIES: 4-hydroxy-tetrahydrodipicolinate synthase [unclassified Phyllobacterium]MCX8280029.1 4-hydroxy-tetrahydrodipicolinate synthase [Phyllobacterium sp. 0TCS1.6C]MCX8296196.1 4-hydroxy-tetrahydrodipicolinate synthase [Phyllobacterium sp. 0TCS1.6A]